MRYKMLVIDLDGTLLNDDKNISNENAYALKKAIDKGVKVVLCSGRARISIDRYLKQLDLINKENYLVAHNGALIIKLDSNEYLLERKIKLEYVKELLKYVENRNINTQIYLGDTIYVDKITDRLEFERSKLNMNIEIVSKLAEDIDFDIHKISFFGEYEELCKTKENIELKYENTFNLFFSDPTFIEVSDIYSSKGIAIDFLAKKLKYSKDEIISIGDSFNDLSMLKMGGLSVAVSNAPQEIKNNVLYVTNNTNNENAIKEVIEKFIIV